MGYVSLKQLDRSREIASAVFNAAIDRVCGLISKREWDEIKFAGCFADCDPMFTPQASRDLISPRLHQLQFTSTSFRGTCATVTYSARKPEFERLAPTDKAGRLIEDVYAPVRMDIHRDRTLEVEWRNFFAVDTSLPLDSEIRRLKIYVDAGQMTKDQMISAVSDATSSFGITLA
jgi:hypothetical protein